MYKNFKNLQTSTSKLKTADKLIELYANTGDFLKVEPIYKETPKKDILIASGVNLYNESGLIGTVATFLGNSSEKAAKKYAGELAKKHNLQFKK